MTADAGYGVGQVYAELAARAIDPLRASPRTNGRDALIPHRPITRRKDSSGYRMDRFKYDQLNDIVRCPRGEILTPRSETPTGRWFRAETSAVCNLRDGLQF